MWSVLVASGLLLIADFSLRPSYCFQSHSDLSSLTNINNENLNLDSGDSDNKNYVQSKIYSAFDEFNKELEHYNHLGALIAWNISTTFSTKNLDDNQKFTIQKSLWNNHWCGELLKVYHDPQYGHFQFPWDMAHLRQLYLLCRGPRFSSYQLSNVLSVLGSLQQLYNKKICIPGIGECMRMEPDLNHFMERTRDESQLRDAWVAWHETIGIEIKPLYASLIRMLNQGARQAGFKDMGQCWREETEIGDLKELATKLYSDVKYLYSLLHSFVRHKLEKYYRVRFHNGLIPAHLLGNMWAQKWDSLIDIMWIDDPDHEDKDQGNAQGSGKPNGSEKSSSLPSSLSSSLVDEIFQGTGRNKTVIDMVKVAEDFYVSMGLPHLPESFWNNSYFQEEQNNRDGKHSGGGSKANSRNCHGSAANMFGGEKRDYRMLMCAQVNDEDLITIHHELGHIMYFMAYSQLPTIFQDGANSAFHESVGDSVTYDLLHFKHNRHPPTQRHTDSKNMKALLRTGLAKLPQIGFGLIMDLWRWELFENPNRVSEWNDLWWQLNENFLGVTKPHPDYNVNGEGLDAAGKFHIIDNIPYIRYFLGSFLQLQFYEAMCQQTYSSSSWNGDMHHCQIRGSKRAGSLLWRMMEKGTSRHWSEILEEMTGSKQIESRPLLNYFEPLRLWLENELSRLNVNTVGW